VLPVNDRFVHHLEKMTHLPILTVQTWVALALKRLPVTLLVPGNGMPKPLCRQL